MRGLSRFLGKQARKMYSRKIKDFCIDFRRSKIGLAGLVIIAIFVITAVLAPLIAPGNPKTMNLADQMAVPQWFTIFPQYNNLPPSIHSPINWSLKQGSKSVQLEWSSNLINVIYDGRENQTEEVWLHHNFSYPYRPPKTFNCQFSWQANVSNVTYHLELFLVSPRGNFCLWSTWRTTNNTSYSYWDFSKINSRSPLIFRRLSPVLERLGYDLTRMQHDLTQVAGALFSETGEYGLLMHMSFTPLSEEAICHIGLKDTEFTILGLAYGLMGTDKAGSDLFSKLVHGTRISLGIGLLVAVLTNAIGISMGMVAGYMGGFVDEFISRVTDLFLCLPLFPLLLALIFLFGRNVYLIMLLLTLLFWMTLARMIRSQVLSIREKPFIEAARASGGSKSYIMFTQILPNVIPVAFSALVLCVPIAILMESTLSFLGMGDPAITSWGQIINDAMSWGALRRGVWWWIFPPGIAIMIVCVGFVFFGYALDEIVNPRLRRRR